MAISATVEWDVRTTGSDSNGGGFRAGATGTDYSQQNSAQVTYTDLVIGATNTQLTSAANPFGAAHVGNIINVTSGTGFTVGRYEVISVSGVIATMDRAVGTASSTGGAGSLGGALATIGAAANAQSGNNTIHIKAGTYTLTTTVTLTPPVNPDIYLIGYQNSHRDGGTKPLVTSSTNSVDLFHPQATNGAILFRNLSMSHTAATRGKGMNPQAGGAYAQLIVQDCVMDGFSNAINGDNVGASYVFATVILINTEIKNSASDAVRNQGNIYAYSSYIHNNSGNGLVCLGANQLEAVNSVIAVNTASGINASAANPVIRIISSALANNTSDGLTTSTISNASCLMVRNSIMYGNGGYGINAGTSLATTTNVSGYNAYGGNTTGPRNNFSAGTGDVSLSASPFVSSSNYALNASAGAGAACKGAGFPGAAAFGTGGLDIGAVQSTTGGGGGGGGGAFPFIA